MPMHAIIGHLADTPQTLSIAGQVLQHVGRYRQSVPWAKEAGGQLFGTVNTAKICVTDASGPYPGDERTRFRYRSNPAAAQRAIEDRHKRGLLYLGEWHTHAENYPVVSGLDDDAMRRLIASSQLNSNALLMMIVGRARTSQGLAVWSVSREAASPWTLCANPEGA